MQGFMKSPELRLGDGGLSRKLNGSLFVCQDTENTQVTLKVGPSCEDREACLN
jgi:hypothetical protein